MAPHRSQPWLPSRPGLAASYENVAQLVDLLLLHQCRAHHSTDDPNTWPSSRPSLAAHGRDYGLPLVDHLRNIGSPPKLQRQLENHGLLLATICDPSFYVLFFFLRSLFTFSLFTFSFSSSPRVLRSPTVSLAVRDASSVAGSFARPSSPCTPLPVSPLPCLCPDTVW